MNSTLFEKIINREIPAQIVWEDEWVVGFKDVNPQAPVHVLFVTREAIPTLNDLRDDQATIAGRLLLAAATYAKREGFAKSGYRTVINCNADAGQTVFHIHLHLLAGRVLGWPPG
jgi:histidine triad (HIT) family protein